MRGGPQPTKRAICTQCGAWFVMAAKTFKQPCPDCKINACALKKYHKKRQKQREGVSNEQ